MNRRFHIALFDVGGTDACWVSSFEETLARLESLPRMFVELDGSFLWTPPGDSSAQVEGVLYDRSGHMYYAEVFGTCPEGEFNQLLTAFGWPRQQFSIQIVREGTFVAEAEFRKLTFAS